MPDDRLSEDELDAIEQRARQLIGGTWYSIDPRPVLKCTAEIRRLRDEVDRLSARLLPLITPTTEELQRLAQENPPPQEWLDQEDKPCPTNE